MNATTSANIAKTETIDTTTPENWSDEHGLWLSLVVDAYRTDPIVLDDLDARALDDARKLYPMAAERDPEDVLAELASMGYVTRAEMRERGFRSGWTPTPRALAEFGAPEGGLKAEHALLLAVIADHGKGPDSAVTREDISSGEFVGRVHDYGQVCGAWPKHEAFPRIVRDLTRWGYLTFTPGRPNVWSLAPRGHAEIATGEAKS